MKKLFFLLTALLLVSCKTKVNDVNSEVGKLLFGNHKLQRFYCANKLTYVSSRVSEDKLMAKFAWEIEDSTYAICELPVTKLKVRIDNTITTPYVSFEWITGGCSCEYNDRNNRISVEKVMKNNVSLMTIVCKREDFPIDLDLSGL